MDSQSLSFVSFISFPRCSFRHFSFNLMAFCRLKSASLCLILCSAMENSMSLLLIFLFSFEFFLIIYMLSRNLLSVTMQAVGSSSP